MDDPLRDMVDRFRSGEPVVDDGRVLLRIGLAFVLVWFGVDKFVHTSYWPMWVPDALGVLATETGLYLIGVAEVALGLVLLSGRFERETALVVAGYMAAIVVGQGLTPVVRDVGLMFAALYLGVTAPGTVDVDGPSLDRRPAVPSKRALAAVAVVALLVVAGAAVGLGWIDLSGPEPDGGPLVAFSEPTDGADVPAGDVPVEVALDPRVHEIGLDHVHIKVDGRVVDALYFAPGDDNVTTSVHLEEGRRTVGAYLAYVDHVEYEDSWTAVDVNAG